MEDRGVGAVVDYAAERDVDVGVDLQIRATGLPTSADDRRKRVVVTGGDEDEIGTASREFVHWRVMRQRRDDGLALGWPRGDRRPLDGEVPADEVDVVQLVAVDESAGSDVADHGVVLPTVPQPADHLDGVGGLVEEVPRSRGRAGRTAPLRAGCR